MSGGRPGTTALFRPLRRKAERELYATFTIIKELPLLKTIRKTMLQIADYAQVVVEGEKGTKSPS